MKTTISRAPRNKTTARQDAKRLIDTLNSMFKEKAPRRFAKMGNEVAYLDEQKLDDKVEISILLKLPTPSSNGLTPATIWKWTEHKGHISLMYDEHVLDTE